MYAPGQIERLAEQLQLSDLTEIESALRSMFAVVPAEDIEVKGHRTPAKRLAAQAFREFLKRAEMIDSPHHGLQVPSDGIFIGLIMNGTSKTDTPLFLPLESLTHEYCSGISGSGKSYLSRVIAEGVIAEKRNVVVIDPGNQWAGLLLPEDRQPVLDRFAEFGMDANSARGFPALYERPSSLADVSQSQLESLQGQTLIYSLKGLAKAQACTIASELLSILFHSHARSETEQLRTLVIVEEAHHFTKLRSDDPGTKTAVARIEDAIDLIAREGRKYGLNILLISQTIRDFSHSAATIRQNTATKIFMRSSDLELDYASDYVDDVRQLTKLQPGEAIVCNPKIGSVKVRVRPPFSKVIELSARETAELLGASRPGGSARTAGDPETEALLHVVIKHFEETGEPIILSQAMKRIGVTSGRKKMELVSALERQGLIRSEKLRRRGGPRALYPIS